jgi:hypothetical protein
MWKLVGFVIFAPDILSYVKHLLLGIAYCLFGGFLLLVSLAKTGSGAFTQALICFGAGSALGIIGLDQLRCARHSA